ncbi:hypothetical protein FIBSPDRAFT_849132 [Athelia psychrophila]|uniref:Uncharacterized protein n=1 Tax=Athelia psychrophila TaxID=1759441 RepID=A0A166UYB7_9AGAM|nr:hypothetical protein FIBSPDRAFT_874967 [Fibularhizoctonia sp. CBS 109695]KZP32157.1 hypothetical protein FIBSPDRAFT_849132 [Fibularhizoctonia sp. CBS 109695]
MSARPSQSKGVSADRLMALPSLSGNLSALPQAKSMNNVSLHSQMYAPRAAASEAKLAKALTKSASSFTPTPPMAPYRSTPSRDNASSPPPIMMRKPVRA